MLNPVKIEDGQVAMDSGREFERIRGFYDTVYYKEAGVYAASATPHYAALASRLGIANGQRVLDVACGLGQWLKTCSDLGAKPYGVDLSEKAIKICRQVMPDGEFYAQAAETLPFDSGLFDVVSCLGSLEHFINQKEALKEMIRVAKPSAKIVLLVPNEDFLTRRLGLYSGTHQVAAKEELRTLDGWRSLFEECGLEVRSRWKDLHVLSWYWISSRGLVHIPLRAAQAVALTIWPLKWQYQVYHLCQPRSGT
jgi:SAM-dependent methyltransferase